MRVMIINVIQNYATITVRFAVDLVVCSALGVDMYDCVYPTRTAVRKLITGFSPLKTIITHSFGCRNIN